MDYIVINLDAAAKHGADPERAYVWSLLAQLWTDQFVEEELHDVAQSLARSSFSTAELAHIAYYEVNPVRLCDLVNWPGSTWGAIDQDWLFPRCLKQQGLNRYNDEGRNEEIPLFMRVLAPFWLELYLMILRVKRIRTL